MCLDIAERNDKLSIMASQVKFIKQQEKDEIPAKHTKIRCSCLTLVRWVDAYRCLYCGIFYCRACAEQHFGKTIEEYRAERA